MFFVQIIEKHYDDKIESCLAELSDLSSLDPGSALMARILCGSAWPTWAIRGSIMFWRYWLDIRALLAEEINGDINWSAALACLRAGKSYEEIKQAATPHRGPRP